MTSLPYPERIDRRMLEPSTVALTAPGWLSPVCDWPEPAEFATDRLRDLEPYRPAPVWVVPVEPSGPSPLFILVEGYYRWWEARRRQLLLPAWVCSFFPMISPPGERYLHLFHWYVLLNPHRRWSLFECARLLQKAHDAASRVHRQAGGLIENTAALLRLGPRRRRQAEILASLPLEWLSRLHTRAASPYLGFVLASCVTDELRERLWNLVLERWRLTHSETAKFYEALEFLMAAQGVSNLEALVRWRDAARFLGAASKRDLFHRLEAARYPTLVCWNARFRKDFANLGKLGVEVIPPPRWEGEGLEVRFTIRNRGQLDAILRGLADSKDRFTMWMNHLSGAELVDDA